jgi:flagellar biogenesis protein FliO
MQRHARWNRISILLGTGVLMGALSCLASAQVGPYRAEIPLDAPPQQPESQVDTRSTQNGEPSQSEFVRPAMDELLLAKARESASQDSSSKTNLQSSEGLSTSELKPQSSFQSQTDSLPIGLPAQGSSLFGASATDEKASSIDQGWTQTIVALLGVILLILGLGQLYKRLARSQGSLTSKLGAGGTAPAGLVEVIGRYPISRGMTLIVMRFDRRVLLLSHASSTKGRSARGASMQTLCELSDPEDIASILLKARSDAGESIAQSFEQTLREADSLADEHLHDMDLGQSEISPVRFPSNRSEPVRTITTDEGDRAELWSSGQDSRAAAGVLRQRLTSMRREQRG